MSFLINPYVFVAPSGYDPDAADYISRVETADGQALEASVKDLINDLFVGVKADGIFGALKASCIMAGARTLAGALTPLVGAAPDNGDGSSFQFVEADYDRKLGLQGSKLSPYPLLLANRLSSDDPQDNHHCSIYVTEQGQVTPGGHFIMSARSGSDYTEIAWSNSTLITRSRGITAFTSPNIAGLGATFLGIARSSSTDFNTRYYGTTATTSSTSNPPANYEYRIFGFGNASNFNGRATFYSIGESLDLALLDARVSTFMSSLAALSL